MSTVFAYFVIWKYEGLCQKSQPTDVLLRHKGIVLQLFLEGEEIMI